MILPWRFDDGAHTGNPIAERCRRSPEIASLRRCDAAVRSSPNGPKKLTTAAIPKYFRWPVVACRREFVTGSLGTPTAVIHDAWRHPKAMKVQPRILPLRCAQCQDDSAKGEGDAAYSHSRSFAELRMTGSLVPSNVFTATVHSLAIERLSEVPQRIQITKDTRNPPEDFRIVFSCAQRTFAAWPASEAKDLASEGPAKLDRFIKKFFATCKQYCKLLIL